MGAEFQFGEMKKFQRRVVIAEYSVNVLSAPHCTLQNGWNGEFLCCIYFTTVFLKNKKEITQVFRSLHSISLPGCLALRRISAWGPLSLGVLHFILNLEMIPWVSFTNWQFKWPVCHKSCMWKESWYTGNSRAGWWRELLVELIYN